jgi:hypothetical protein
MRPQRLAPGLGAAELGGLGPAEGAVANPLGGLVVAARAHCPGRKLPFLAVKRPARPYKSPIQHRLI